jgi:hypothetical protein
MEIDYSANGVCKESGDGALLTAEEPAGGSLADSPMQIGEGQWPISG